MKQTKYPGGWRRFLVKRANILACAVCVAACLLLLLAPSIRVSGSAFETGTVKGGVAQSKLKPHVSQATGFAESAAVRDLQPAKLAPGEGKKRQEIADRKVNEKNEERLKETRGLIEGARSVDRALQSNESPTPNIPAPAVTFDGLSNSDNAVVNGFTVLPSDDNMDVGPNHIVQTVNDLFRIFNKSGTALTPAAKISSLFAPLGSPCGTRDDGDPIVLYDPLADRWLISQFCISFNPNMHQVIAISKSGDPTGQYFLYDFVMPNNKFHDYPHYGVWPDGYYLTTNQFNQSGTQFLGAGAFAFDRKKMLQGDPSATYVYFDEFLIDPTLGGELPTDIDGVVTPPVGTPNLFIEFRATEFGSPADALRMFEFHADFVTPANSSFTQKPDLALLAFDASQPSSIHAVEQPAPATQSSYLDAIADRVLHRLAYRTLAGGVLSYVLNFTVNVSGVTATTASNYQAGIRWVELRRNPGTGAMTINQQGTYAPGAGDGANGRNVWMGSVAQDHQGDIALGFSASSSTQFPSVMYAGRLPGDSAGTLAQGEATLFAGSGSQQHTAGRWGDYSAMSVDPADECTFWYTNQYLNASGSSPWRTRIGSFKVDPNCAAPQKGTIIGVITNCVGGTPVQGASITTPEGFFRQTDATGNYSISVAPGTYNLSVSKPGSGFNTCTGNVTVSAGGTGTFSCCLQPAPIIVSTSAAFVSEGCAPANGAIDPGETVTMSLCLKDTGGLSTTNLVGTLQATGGVSNPGGAQTYGIVVAGGVPVCQNFTFTASGTCSGTLTATVQLQDGATNLGTITYTFVLGSPGIAFDEKFDGVTAPALPGGWVAANAAGGAPLWVTSTTGPDTSPNCVFVDCPSSESDKRLDTPPIPIVNATALLSFRHNYLFRDSGGGFDGGVLEVSSPNINGGAFTDLTNPAVGGSFVQNGYTSTIDIDFGSPIGGRQAWSGSSNGYLTTTANLGSNVAGHTIKLRWRMGSDESISDTGWFIDTIVINDGNICCVAGGVCTITCPANITKPTDSNQCSGVVNYAAPTTSGNCGTVTCAPASGSAFAKGVTTVNCTTAAGPSCSFTVTVQDTQAPTLTCPANININGNCPAAVNYSSPSVSDNCSGAGLPVCNPPSGSAFPVGTTGVTCNVTDASGNPGSCSFNITVTGTPDLQPPTFPNGSPQPINVAAAFQCPYATSAQVNYTNPIAADNCAGVTVACNPPSGSTFPVGSTVVTCTATDTSNNIATRSFAVTVYSACLADETNTLNVVMFNAATGDYRYCCSGALVATGRGTLTASGCDVTIEHLKGNRRVRISVTGAGQGSGTAFVQRGGVQGCQITDLHMNDSVCNCP